MNIEGTIKLECTPTGIYGITNKEVTNTYGQKFITHTSTFCFHEEDLFEYFFNESYLRDVFQNFSENICFTLEFKTTTIVQYFKSLPSGAKISIYFDMNSTVIIFVKSDSGGPLRIPVEFSIIPTIISLDSNITSPNLKAMIKVETEKISTISNDLTRVNGQASYDIFIKFQFNHTTGSYAMLIDSTEERYNLPLNGYNFNEPPEVCFVISFELMRGLSLSSKLNHHGFINFYFFGNNILRYDCKIGNFGIIKNYIFGNF